MPPDAFDHLQALETLIAPSHREAAAVHVAALRRQLGTSSQPVLWSRLTMALRTELTEWLAAEGITLRFTQPDDLPLVRTDPDAFVIELRDVALTHGTGGATWLAVAATVEGADVVITVTSDGGAEPWSTRCPASRLTYIE